MAIRNIVLFGDDILKKECRPVEKFDRKLHQLLDDMQDTLYDANGAGLAAPQVGVLRQICIVDVGEGPIELINPEIIATEGNQIGPEGCLSLPNEWGEVSRPMKVTVRAQNRKGKWFEISGEELCARAFCHEIDHLHGIVFTEKANRMLTPEELEAMKEK
ncbi:peptide deformylase [Acutalibacter sp. 1XD8-33]|uniref:peptide deformylase n=1 Tax=Acutalibacter sp. 1XD8-33 TaxID=2320081 RepID=UPI000EA0E18A|nr:peptide deformylase [Acutalibacter sp. 1XD8-33]RKJ40415.1 peptide deformylase [Acutalibacter sp. 1XD8-33]